MDFREEVEQGTRTTTQPATPTVPPVLITTAVHIFSTAEGTCSYIFPGGSACGLPFKTKKDGARHWLATHVLKELKDVDEGTLTFAEAFIIKTSAHLNAANRYRTFCPYNCRKSQVRPDLMVRHMVGCATRQRLGHSPDEVNAWVDKHMVLTRRASACERWKNSLEKAIWEIYQAA